MDMVTTVYVLFMLHGTVHTTDWKQTTYNRGENVKVHMDHLELSGKNVLEIIFSGYTSKQHLTNVMIYNPVKNQVENISININYTGRLQRIEINETYLSFLLLNVSFADSGNYTAIENKLVKGKTSIHVPRYLLLGQDGEPITVTFTCNKTKVTSIKIEIMTSTVHHLVLTYDVTRENNTQISSLYSDRIEGCVLEGSIFFFTIRKVSFLDKGTYVAWGDMDYVLDSVFLDLEDMLEWILVSSVVVLLVAARLIIYALWILQQRITSKSTRNNLTRMNGRPNTDNSSRNCFQDVTIAHPLEGNVMILTEDNISHDLTDSMSTQSHVNIIINGKHHCKRGIDLANSTVSKDEIHFILPSSREKFHSEPAYEYNQVHLYEKVENERLSDHPYLHPRLYTNPTENLAEQTCNYDHVTQHSYITLRPSTMDTILNMKTRENVTIADSFSRHTIINNKSRIDSSTSFANVNQTRHNKIYFTDYSYGLVTPDMECQGEWQTLNYDFTGNSLGISSNRKISHRRSQSCGALFGGPMTDSSVQQLRRNSIGTRVSEDGYDSLRYK
ncbi:hypothetical protein CHS0354_020865 [Potamilus streckersoni]|uniref:Uncharacterized protein n=1 Tax=Potamilus streckersoni TaxID=2493646 RepID=A0AAE0SF38_9BIVA|nr:hypothetical protein CHS0354_020865 [Potamilus streckersoni]